MSDIDATSESYDVDYTFAPVGLFVTSFWIGSLVVGLIAFVFNCLTAHGFAPYIVDGQRSWIKDDAHGVQDGVVVMLVLIVLSTVAGVVGRLTTLKGGKLDRLWPVSLYLIPGIAAVLAIASVFVHP